MKKIGIIGAGIMASGMAQNFLKSGYEVTMWNRSPLGLKPLEDLGAVVADTPKQVTELSDIIIECVSDDIASKSVWTGDDGILAGATTSKVLIVSSSLSINWTDELIALCVENSFQFLDMPLTGSRAGAENGTLRLLIGGKEDVLESIRSDLKIISEKIYRFGDMGTGMRFKLILNSLIGIHMNAIGQALNLAEKVGVDKELFSHALIDGNMGPLSPSTKLVLDSKDWEVDHVNFAVQWLEKDLRYAQEMTEQYSIQFDLLRETQRDYADALDSGLSKADVTSIAKYFSK